MYTLFVASHTYVTENTRDLVYMVLKEFMLSTGKEIDSINIII